MFLFRKHKTTQRKYIDLIKGASEKWVNWLAPKNIHVSIRKTPCLLFGAFSTFIAFFE